MRSPWGPPHLRRPAHRRGRPRRSPGRTGRSGIHPRDGILRLRNAVIRYEIGDVGSLSRAGAPVDVPTGASLMYRRSTRVPCQRPTGASSMASSLPTSSTASARFGLFKCADASSVIDIAIQPTPEFRAEVVEPILAAVRDHFGPTQRVTWRVVQGNPKTPTGKHLFTIAERPVNLGGGVTSPPAPGPTSAIRSPQPDPRAVRRPRILLLAHVPNWILRETLQASGEGSGR